MNEEGIIKKLEDILSDYDNDRVSDIQDVAALCNEKLVATLNDKQKLLLESIFTLDSIRDDMLCGDSEEAVKSICYLIDYIKGEYPLRGNSKKQDEQDKANKEDVLCMFCSVACKYRDSKDKSNCYMIK